MEVSIINTSANVVEFKLDLFLYFSHALADVYFSVLIKLQIGICLEILQILLQVVL